MKKAFVTLFLIGLLPLSLMAQGNGHGKGGNTPGKGFNGGMAALIAGLPYQKLSQTEKAGMLRMREEEKLARDVYMTLFRTWDHRMFKNIARSEYRHMEAVRAMLQKYNIPDPVSNDTIGVFADPNLQILYINLTADGSVSLIEALRVGAFIEELDIFDLKKFLLTADNSDLKTVYQNLMKGSRNHLRAFFSQITQNGASYQRKYLSQAEIDAIVNSPMEKGLYDENGNPLYGHIGW